MERGQRGSVVRHLHQIGCPEGAGEMTDVHLLERFTLHRDEVAFAALVDCYGPMVLGLCRRVLGDAQEAEDAFQETFLVLARKSGSIRESGSLGGWLYRVAYRIAVRRRASAARRQTHEREAVKVAPADARTEVIWREVTPVLDEELSRLPEKYRAPLVLCYLNGKTNEQAARQLGWTKGTISGRLARARELLRTRLVQRGFALSASLFAALLSQKTAVAMPASLATSTGNAVMRSAGEKGAAAVSEQAATLAEETLKDVGTTRLKTGVGVLLVILVSSIAVVSLAYEGFSAARPNVPQGGGPRPVLAGDDACAPISGVQAGLERFPGPVHCVAFAPDGRTLATAGSDKTLTLWDADWHKEPARLRGHQGPVYSLSYAPDGGLLASGSADSTVRLWDMASRKERAVIRAHAGGVRAVAFAPDGKSLASGGADCMVRLWDVASGKERATLQGHTGSVHALAFSSDGKTLVSGSSDRSIKVWDVGTGRVRATLTRHSGEVCSVAFSPDDTTVASGGGDQTIWLWDAATGRPRTSLRGHQDEVRSVVFTPDGRGIISGSWDRTIKLWDAVSGQERASLHGHTDGINTVACTRGGITLASGAQDRTVKVWRLK